MHVNGKDVGSTVSAHGKLNVSMQHNQLLRKAYRSLHLLQYLLIFQTVMKRMIYHFKTRGDVYASPLLFL